LISPNYSVNCAMLCISSSSPVIATWPSPGYPLPLHKGTRKDTQIVCARRPSTPHETADATAQSRSRDGGGGSIRRYILSCRLISYASMVPAIPAFADDCYVAAAKYILQLSGPIAPLLWSRDRDLGDGSLSMRR
jgi:hypothetical protein